MVIWITIIHENFVLPCDPRPAGHGRKNGRKFPYCGFPEHFTLKQTADNAFVHKITPVAQVTARSKLRHPRSSARTARRPVDGRSTIKNRIATVSNRLGRVPRPHNMTNSMNACVYRVPNIEQIVHLRTNNWAEFFDLCCIQTIERSTPFLGFNDCIKISAIRNVALKSSKPGTI